MSIASVLPLIPEEVGIQLLLILRREGSWTRMGDEL